MLSDEQIIQGIKQGGHYETRAIEELYDHNKGLFMSFLSQSFQIEKSKEPKDIIWETIEAFVNNVKNEKFKLQDNIPISAYIKTISKNLAYKYYSSENARSGRQETYFAQTDQLTPDVSEVLSEKEIWDEYLTIFEKAGKNCKRILHMVYGLGYGIKEMAQELIVEGVFESEQTVRNAKSKCLKKVSDNLMLQNKPNE